MNPHPRTYAMWCVLVALWLPVLVSCGFAVVVGMWAVSVKHEMLSNGIANGDSTHYPYSPSGASRIASVWVCALVAIAVVGTGIVAFMRLDTLARRRARVNHCPKCNYDRAGLAKDVVCPECGARPHAPLP